MTQLAQRTWQVQHGETIDIVEQIACILPADPRTDGSRFSVYFSDANGVDWLAFDTGFATRNASIDAWTVGDQNANPAIAPSVTLSFRARESDVRNAPVGPLTGVLYVRRPRESAFGDESTALAMITLTIGAGSQ